MKARTVPIVLLFVLSAVWSNDAIAADTSQVLVLEREIPLDHVSGRIDHMAIDLERRHLAVAELGNNTVDLIDLNNGRVMNRISGLDEPQGIAFVPSSDLFAVASGGDGSVKLFKGSDFSPAGVINLGDDADNVRLNRTTGHIVVGYGQGGLAVIDPITHSKLADIALRAHPEGFQLSSDGSRAFVNVPDARQIASVDLSSGKQVATWKMAELRSNFPMAIDESGEMLAIAFRDPPRLTLLDAQSGAITADVETCGDSDDVFFDDRRARIYVSCGAGAVDVFERSDGGIRRVAQVKTHSGARTSLFVPELDRLFVASRSALLGNDAKIMVFRPSP
jgi:DNA-binding beta-propeller fold protein YncE